MTPADLRAIIDKATPGPWKLANWGFEGERPCTIEGPDRVKPPEHVGFCFEGVSVFHLEDDFSDENVALLLALRNRAEAFARLWGAAQLIVDQKKAIDNYRRDDIPDIHLLDTALNELKEIK